MSHLAEFRKVRVRLLLLLGRKNKMCEFCSGNLNFMNLKRGFRFARLTIREEFQFTHFTYAHPAIFLFFDPWGLPEGLFGVLRKTKKGVQQAVTTTTTE